MEFMENTIVQIASLHSEATTAVVSTCNLFFLHILAVQIDFSVVATL